MLLRKQRKDRALKQGHRFLVSVTVVGSPGPIRFVVNEDDLVAAVIDRALKSYAREGRLPILGSHLNNFMLYSQFAGTEALLPWVTIGSSGVRSFCLCKKPRLDDDKVAAPVMSRKGVGSWRSWFHKSPNTNITSH